MNDLDYMSDALQPGATISGPWRLTVWEKTDCPPCYVFSEEHANEGSCPENKDITVLAKEVLSHTENVHVFIEHFVHAMDINNVKLTEKEACSAKSKAILNNMRHCLEVLRVERPGENKRIHFVDPRMDIVAVLPDGKLYEAISHYADHLQKQGDVNGALVTVYEAFIHPLLSIVPDKFGVDGRMTGVMERYRNKMTETQREFFLRTWNTDVVQKIKALSDKYVAMQKSNNISQLDKFKLSYTDMVNKFMDMCLLAQFFVAQNHSGMSAALVYAGSLHSLNFETYLERFGFKRTRLHENKDLSACIKL